MNINTEEILQKAEETALLEIISLNNKEVFLSLAEDFDTLDRKKLAKMLRESFISGVKWVFENNIIDNSFQKMDISDAIRIQSSVGIIGLSIYANVMSKYYEYSGLFNDLNINYSLELSAFSAGLEWCYGYICPV